MELRLLGPFEVLEGGRPVQLGGRKQRAVLALLALNANRTVATERIVDEVWGEDVPETATKMVQVYVSQLRKVLPPRTIKTQAPGYVLEADPANIDVVDFERRLADARANRRAGDPRAARELLDIALEKWRGVPLAEFRFEPFGRTEGPRLEELHLAALEERIEADLALGRHDDIIGELEALVTRQPLRERLRGQQMLALYRAGRHADALASYQAYRELLDEDLGIEPSGQLKELHRSILNQDSSLELEPPSEEPTPSSAVAAVRHVDGRAKPIAGRDAELGRIRASLESALTGERQLVFVTGEAGRGKTTLVNAFLAELDERQDLLVGRGQCVEQGGAGEPYMPILDALGRMSVSPGGAVVVDLLSTRAPTWLAQMPWLVPPDVLDQIEHRVFGASRERMLREMVEALDQLAGRRPLVLVLEDLHWSDPSTVELLAAIARRDDPSRLLVIGTFRPPDSRSPRGSVHDAVQELRLRGLSVEIPLQPLTEQAVAEVVAARAEGRELPEFVPGIVHAHTGGNPLFVETLLDAWLAEGGVLSADASADELATVLPESLRELIEQRLSAIAPDELALLEAGAVAGGEFPSAAVAAAVERPSDEVERLLLELARRGDVLQPAGEEDWPDGTFSSRFAFAHDLYGEVIYDRLPAGLRIRLHERIGRRLEDAYGDSAHEVASELAEHFLRARDAERALRSLEAAAVNALTRTAAVEALSHATAGLRVVDTIPPGSNHDRAELRLESLRGQALVGVEGWSSERAVEAQNRALELARSLDDRESAARALFALGSLYEVQGRYQESERVLDESLAVSGGDGAPASLADVHEVMACSLFHQGRFEQAISHADQGLEDVQRSLSRDAVTASYGDSPGVACHGWAAVSLWFLGQPDAALARAREGAVVSAEHVYEYGRPFALGQAAIVTQLRGEPESTLDWAKAGIAAASERGYVFRVGQAQVLHGWARAALGDVEGGLVEIMSGIETYNGTGAHMDDPYFLGLLGDALVEAGDTTSALETVDEALARIARTYFYEPELHRLRGRILRRLGSQDEGAAALHRSLERAREMFAVSLELRAATDVAQLLYEAGDSDTAMELLVSVRDQFTEGFDTVDMRRADALLSELGHAVGPADEIASRAVPRAAIHYARSGGLSIAYQVTGSGPPDIVLVPGFVSHLEKDWEEPRYAHFLQRLGAMGRLIRFDKRGTGLSDRPGDLPDLEARMDDVRAVIDAVGSERAILFGYSEGGPLSILFAATYPERVEALVLYGTYAVRMRTEGYPWAPTREERLAYAEQVERDWGTEADMHLMCPGADEALARWWGERTRAAASPGAARALVEMNSQIDVRDVLPAIRVPTLVMHRTGDRDSKVEEGRFIAERVPDGQFVELSGDDHFPAVDPDQILDVAEPFLRDRTVYVATPVEVEADRMLATILVTDIVSSTETVERLGDRAWSELLARYHRVVRQELERFSGVEINTTGDGLVAYFDGPSRAVRCGQSIAARVTELGLESRQGVHTGEVEKSATGVLGIAVHTAFRVAGEAGVNEVLVTATTRDLVSGSGFDFVERGVRTLKGLEEPRRLYALVASASEQRAPASPVREAGVPGRPQ